MQLCIQVIKIQFIAAHDLLYGFPAQAIIIIEFYTSADRQLAGANMIVVFIQCLYILRKQPVKTADGADPQ